MSKIIYRIYINDSEDKKSFIYDKDEQIFYTPQFWNGDQFIINENQFNSHLEVIKNKYKGATVQIRKWNYNPYYKSELLEEYKLNL